MSKLTILVFSLLGFISACVGQGVIQSGQCDENVAVLTNFIAASYANTWYDIESLPSVHQTGTCNTAQYTVTNAGLNIVNSQVTPAGLLATATGTATLQPGVPAGTAKFNVLIGTSTQAVPYWVLDTDYTTFALVYSCVNVDATTRRVNSWKLGRATGPLPIAAQTRINTVINNVPALSAAANQYITRDHSEFACSYLVEVDGQCPTNLVGASNFDASVFQGTWYEFARYRQPSQTGQCNRAEYVVGANGVVSVQNSQVTNESLSTISGAAFEVTGRPGVLQVNFNVGGVLRRQNLVVLATDNTNYALLYSCENLSTTRRRIGSWQMRKQLTALDATYINTINAVIDANTDLDRARYQSTSQSDTSCFYYPQFDTLPATIDLPGPCSLASVTGTTAFNAATFVGTWYEVARYPQPTQPGQCNRATYAAGTGNIITILNSQVVNETLGTISGQATAVVGQSGVLQVTLNTSSGPTTQTLYVLATDNTNYALLYSCTDIAGNRRRVGSWKLSKQIGSLSAAATAAIDNVIGNTQGLSQSYYQSTYQTDAACFYYPQWETLPATIDLPGPCDTTITGVAGFNSDRFLGTWYEVARYPQPTQAGQCNRATYALSGGVITVQNRQVTAEALSTISGQATPVAGQSGVLQVTLNTSAGPTTQTLYVLDTDYDNYALLYTCTNLAGNTRRVGSWQMRKHLGPVTAEVNAAINSKIEAVQGLRQSYYQTTYQTDAACFYYPVWETLPATIDLPGPCNTAITGTTAFNPTTFLGTWYEVARYPQPTQGGQCNRATYAAGTGGVITVQNRQVTAETLSTISGQAAVVTGQTGVLQVNLTTSSGLTTQNLVVLATDNTNYALLYSCENIPENRRRVGSWRMSKQLGPLSAAANATIDSVIASTQGLSQAYYQNTSQTNAACFHYPATQAGEKVIIPGQCDATTIGQSNINITRFANGTWYHIQRYDQVGNRTCIGTRLSLDQADEQTFINVNNVELAGGVENRTEGLARFFSPANGQFDLVWSGSNDTTRITIMATDYDGYAIAYTCANINSDYREVGVWLLSRGRTWPPSGVTAFATLANTRQEFTLREGYLKAIPHNDTCPEPSSAFLYKSSIIVIFVCTVLQLVW